MSILNFLNQTTAIVQNALILAAIVGSIFVFLNTKKAGLVKIQSDTIEAMQKQIDALKEQNAQQQKKLDQQEYRLEAVTEALKDEGILITIDGEKVTITTNREPNTTRHIIRRPAKKAQPSAKEEP